MSLVLLDTDTLTYFLKGNPTVVARAVQHIRLYGQLNISLITQYEVLHGLLYRDARTQLPRFEQLLSRHYVLPLTTESVRISAAVFADLKKRGQLIGHTDTLIAGVALANGMQLATNNTAHFSRIEGLHLVNWTQ